MFERWVLQLLGCRKTGVTTSEYGPVRHQGFHKRQDFCAMNRHRAETALRDCDPSTLSTVSTLKAQDQTSLRPPSTKLQTSYIPIQWPPKDPSPQKRYVSSQHHHKFRRTKDQKMNKQESEDHMNTLRSTALLFKL